MARRKDCDGRKSSRSQGGLPGSLWPGSLQRGGMDVYSRGKERDRQII